jgi:hypothetical protein
MTLDDDSILSAYLDGQLGPEEQQAVESAVLDDPRLADELSSLVVLRDLLAGLPRESPVDLTSRVMRRVRRRALLGTARGFVAWGPARAAGMAAVAAAVLMMLAAPWLLHLRRRPADAAGPHVAAVSGSMRKVRPTLSADRWPAFSPHTARKRATPPGGPAEPRPSQAESSDGVGSAQDELLHVREYLDHPQLRHIFMVSDPGDGSDERRVASVVEQTTRFNYYKITISQGIVLDPRHPDQAEVFALVVGPRELNSLRDRLRMALQDRVEEESAEPGVVTRLADIGRVEACRPSPSADMDIPRDGALAFKEGGAGDVGEAPEPPHADHRERDDGPTPEQEYSAPTADLDRPRRSPAPGVAAVVAGATTAGGPAPAEAPDESLVVLIWVSRGHPG